MKRVVWGIDALQSDLPLVRRPLQFLEGLKLNDELDLRAVYLLSQDQLSIGDTGEVFDLSTIKPGAENALKHLVEQLKSPFKVRRDVLTHNKHSLSASAKALSDYARFEKADFILISSHTRRGLKRLVLGSFAETLVQTSEVPVVVVGAQTYKQPTSRTILFSTDFSKDSFKALPQVIELAKKTSSKLRLFYVIPNPIEPVFQAGTTLLGGVWVPVERHGREVKKKIKEASAEWLKRCQADGVKADVRIVDARASVAQEVLREAKTNPPLFIAMVTKSGPLSTFFIGSITREVLRASLVPVWVMRQK